MIRTYKLLERTDVETLEQCNVFIRCDRVHMYDTENTFVLLESDVTVWKSVELEIDKVVIKTESDGGEGEVFHICVVLCFNICFVVEVIGHRVAEENRDEAYSQDERGQPYVLSCAFVVVDLFKPMQGCIFRQLAQQIPKLFLLFLQLSFSFGLVI